MAFLFKDYIDLVLGDYRLKREANKLSRLLIHNTTANLRQECLNVYKERKYRGEKNEDHILRDFFGVPKKENDFAPLIEEFSADRLRPLQSFMNGGIKNPALPTVELLAWLIDFRPRPLEVAKKLLGPTYYTDHPDKKTGEGTIETTSNGEKEDLISNTPVPTDAGAITLPVFEDEPTTHPPLKHGASKGWIKKRKTVLTAGMASVIIFGGIYGFGELSKTAATGDTECMYWTVDHYDKVDCKEDKKGRLFLPLEVDKMRTFRMILRKDTITEWSIGKIFYIQDKNKIKYYTEGGYYPEDLTRSLRRLTSRIFEKDSINRKLNN